MSPVATGAGGLEDLLAGLAQCRGDPTLGRVDLLLAEEHCDVHPLLHAQVLRQLGHDEVGPLAAGELLEGIKQVLRILPSQIGDVLALAVAGFTVAVDAEHRALLAGQAGLLAPLLVGHDLVEALDGLLAGMGERNEAGKQSENELTHGRHPLLK